MKKSKQPVQEELQDLIEEPYKYFDGVDYKRIMALNIGSIRIDSKNEQVSAPDLMKNQKQSKHKLKACSKKVEGRADANCQKVWGKDGEDENDQTSQINSGLNKGNSETGAAGKGNELDDNQSDVSSKDQ